MILPRDKIKKIGIFRALQLGDMLNVIPAIRVLRYAYPDTEIILIGMPWEELFVKRFNQYFNRFLHFPGYEGLPEQPFDKTVYNSFVVKMRKENFDLLLQMQGNGTIVNVMLQKWNAKHIAGFYNEESFVDSPLFMQYPNYGSEIYRHLMLMQHLGLPLQDDDLEFPITADDEKEYQNLDLLLAPKSYVCIHPGSRGAWRQWPPKYFAKLADLCAEKGLTVVVTGTQEEKDITADVIKQMKYNAINLTGKTSLGAIALLIQNAFCLVANCTGVSHIASATKTPSIIISIDGEPERWSPLNKNIHFVTDWTKQPIFSIPYQQLNSLLNRKYKPNKTIV